MAKAHVRQGWVRSGKKTSEFDLYCGQVRNALALATRELQDIVEKMRKTEWRAGMADQAQGDGTDRLAILVKGLKSEVETVQSDIALVCDSIYFPDEVNLQLERNHTGTLGQERDRISFEALHDPPLRREPSQKEIDAVDAQLEREEGVTAE